MILSMVGLCDLRPKNKTQVTLLMILNRVRSGTIQIFKSHCFFKPVPVTQTTKDLY
jgi:hypothetical protein